MDIVRQVLDEERREAEKYKSIEVVKHLDADVDLGYLLCSDGNELDEQQLRYVYIRKIDYNLFMPTAYRFRVQY